ncbi:MAG: hypothetical protein HOE92_04580 [Euryarchaeota archaeon]|jgi:thiamine biosynthesis protein ThiI|nr:hypothetical protein [Euryarchaeota archaeon]MBT3971476.1 hypothetical protein [Euryarchaeota archaeon]MBT4407885.1 hypothetical protein [Euryarchaeota archaeon]MBT6644927.1 hypothetical protein [Euryarchaeota archaeon]
MREVNGVLQEGLEPTQQIKGDEVHCPSTSSTKVAVALVSGGIDSPVAVARMLAQGWIIYPLHGSLEPLTGDEAERKTISCLRQLSNNNKLFQKNSNLVEKLFVIPIGDTLSLFTDKKMHRDYFVHMKRLLNVMANRLAEEVGATHIITGENIGQVSSQTLGNLGAVERSSERPILRPLLALDKVDIIHMAQALGTFEISTGPEDCDIIGPNHPTTVADLRRLEENEKDIGGLEEIVNTIWDELRIVKVG